MRDGVEHEADREAAEVGARRPRDAEGVKVGFVGLGNMGGRITRRIVAGGYTVLGYDVDPTRAAASGASVRRLPGRRHRKDSTSSSCPFPTARSSRPSSSATTGSSVPERPGQVVVDLTTSQPTSTQRAPPPARRTRRDFVDAGISGGAAAADKGTLTLMAGGAGRARRPPCSHFSARVYFMGEGGAGHTTKILNNFLNGVSLAATAEVMVAAGKAGLELTPSSRCSITRAG